MCAFLFGGAGTGVNIPTLPLKTREGWGTPDLSAVLSGSFWIRVLSCLVARERRSKSPPSRLKRGKGGATRSLSAVFVGEFLDSGCAFLFGGTEVNPTLPLKRGKVGHPGF